MKTVGKKEMKRFIIGIIFMIISLGVFAQANLPIKYQKYKWGEKGETEWVQSTGLIQIYRSDIILQKDKKHRFYIINEEKGDNDSTIFTCIDEDGDQVIISLNPYSGIHTYILVIMFWDEDHHILYLCELI